MGQEENLDYLLSQVGDIQSLINGSEERQLASVLELCLTPKLFDDDYACLNTLLIHYFQQAHVDEKRFFPTLNIHINELATIHDMPFDTPTSIHAIKDLQAALKADVARRPAYQKAVSLCLQIGPLTPENKAQYLQALQREHLHHQRTLRAAGETVFTPWVNGFYTLLGQPPAPLPTYDTKKADQNLTTLIQQVTEKIDDGEQIEPNGGASSTK